jgi:hypothetical protein
MGVVYREAKRPEAVSTPREAEQKFFGSFFQKRTAFLLEDSRGCRPYSLARIRATPA